MAKENVSKLLEPVVKPEQMDPRFSNIISEGAPEPARKMLELAFEAMSDPDGNFVEQFQTTGFAARYFELYLNQYFLESGFNLTRDYPQPDFFIEKGDTRVGVEATTVNPSAKIKDPLGDERMSQEKLEYLRNDEVPVRLGSALYSKLSKRYWERPHCQGLPLVIAIESFFSEVSLSFSDNSIGQYLFGRRYYAKYGEDGRPAIADDKIESHIVGDKEIPSGFFRSAR